MTLPARHSTSIGLAPVSSRSSSYVVENTAAGWPAAAHTTSYRWSQESRYVGTGAGWPIGETPPITCPVCSRTNSGEARRSFVTPTLAAVLRGVHPVRSRGEDQHRRAVGVEEQAVGDRSDLAAERFGSECGGVDGIGQNDDLASSAASCVLGAEPADRGVVGRHGCDPRGRADVVPPGYRGAQGGRMGKRPAAVDLATWLLWLQVVAGLVISVLVVVFREDLEEAWSPGRSGDSTVQPLDFVPVILVLYAVVAVTTLTLVPLLRAGHNWADMRLRGSR